MRLGKDTQYNNTTMLKNYIKVTFRNMVRNKIFTLINILGLSVSIACCLLLFLYVSNQLGYDRHHGNNVYRVTSYLAQKSGETFNAASSSIPVAATIREEIPEIIESGKLMATSFGGKNMIIYKGESSFVENGAVADTSLFKILNYELTMGNSNSPLPHPNAVILSTEWANRLFTNENPMGKMIKISTMMGVAEYEVTGVFDEKRYQTHFEPSYIISTLQTDWNNFLQSMSTQWVGNNMAYTYIRINDSADPMAVEEKIAEVFQKYGAEEMEATGLSKVMHLQPVEDIHTTTEYKAEVADVIDKTFIEVLMGIGVLILILACVNYINLSTAQAGNRSLEVGVRKVMGITNRGLVMQFLGESFVIVFVSVCFSILFAELTLPIFNQLVDHPIDFNLEAMKALAIYGVSFLFITSFVAGIYPAVYLSSFKPTIVLKGRNKDKGSVSLLRKVLVVFQFVISIVLISSILIISEQVNFIKNKDLGFDTNSRIVLPLGTNEVQAKFDVLKQKISSLAQVKKVGGAAVTPGMQIGNDLLVYKNGQTMEDAIHIYNNDVDKDYLQTIGVKLIAGTYFPVEKPKDSLNRIIVNAEALRQLDMDPEESIGERVYFDWRGMNFQFEIVGVAQDINQFSLHEGIDPMMFTLEGQFGNGFSYMILETSIEDYNSVIPNLRAVWKEVNPEDPFESYALDDHMIKQYESDFKTFNLIKYFAFISVFISCMGLYALSMFIAERRFKEIGVRKAMGASIRDIIFLVTKDLSLLIIFAFVVSIPLSMIGMNKWLETFAYHITPGVTIYILAGIISVLIGWITISYQSIRAAKTNPVNVLKDE